MNPGNFPAGQHLVPDDAVGRQETDRQIVHSQLFQGRQERSRSRDGVIEHSIIFQPVQPFSKPRGLPFGPQPGAENSQPAFRQNVLQGPGQRPVSRELRQQVHFFRNQRHQISGMPVNEQVNPETGSVQRLQQPQQGTLRAPQFHVLNSYENTLHLHASLRT